MARGELVKKLLLSYGHEDEFRAVVEQIIAEEEKKNNRVLSRSLRKTLDNLNPGSQTKALNRLIPFPDEANDYIQRIEPTHSPSDIILTDENIELLQGLEEEFRRSEMIKRHGLPIRSKLLFCGPPGTGKTLCSEVFAAQLGLPLFYVKLDSLISSFLGETASNIRKTFEFARRQPCVLFFDEFDALARSREEGSDHSELRRVVNSLLIFIDQIQPGGFIIAATNMDAHLDAAIWRRFDEVIWFDNPDEPMMKKYLNNAFKNACIQFNPEKFIPNLKGYSYAELERVCTQAIKATLLNRRKKILRNDFKDAISNAERRKKRLNRLSDK